MHYVISMESFSTWLKQGGKMRCRPVSNSGHLASDILGNTGHFVISMEFWRSLHAQLLKCAVTRLQRICYSHWANGARNGVISIGQWGVFNHEKGAI